MYLLGIDLGSSSVKVALVSIDNNETISSLQYPEVEYRISAPEFGWAEQDPDMWWTSSCVAIKKLLHEAGVDGKEVKAIGISYQMHGLVIVDNKFQVIRDAIIWCDSRAVDTGKNAYHSLGEKYCLENLLNAPGNFTASKLAWVKNNEPENYQKINKCMLPGDYLVMKLTGQVSTSVSGLSEAILWDFKNNRISTELLNEFGISEELIAPYYDNFDSRFCLNRAAAGETGLQAGTPVSYRAGDQVNNAMSLGVMDPGEVAATGGTSGVIYAIAETVTCKPDSGFNAFVHVNHSKEKPRLGCLMCINGAGSLYAWLKRTVGENGLSYSDMELELESIPAGADGLKVFPFGNGAERLFANKDISCHIQGLNFYRHTKAHLYRAGIEGVAYAFRYGIDSLKDAGLKFEVINAGHSNLFLSPRFVQILSELAQCPINLYDTSGATGAALGAGIGLGLDIDIKKSLTLVKQVTPDKTGNKYETLYQDWLMDLNNVLN